MSPTLVHRATILYGDVDREECLLLAALAKLLQEAAISQANLFNTGTRSLTERRQTWVLNRLALSIQQYPRYLDEVEVETWSRGIVGFRGYREYRVRRSGQLIASASSLWLYADLRSKALARVPQEIVDQFPIHDADAYATDIQKLTSPSPSPAAPSCNVSLRYSDVDANGHVNNTAYFEILQTGLENLAGRARPEKLFIRFLREILPTETGVRVQIDSEAWPATFCIQSGTTTCAQGWVSVPPKS
jgi:medium-chain acyl-[acyl-carrier-protein] hydrolase